MQVPTQITIIIDHKLLHAITAGSDPQAMVDLIDVLIDDFTFEKVNILVKRTSDDMLQLKKFLHFINSICEVRLIADLNSLSEGESLDPYDWVGLTCDL
ncbi:hypothetical protein KGF57_000255 [Candida theae]|uniref:Uncharacterized protein n=1 Tax=Candida theae TaxID=1198502 RepID=A0AAD5BJX3_9ASCO|nr:uncharacterized protein KGF57_000255 [Candida theae]KAI5968065.1 hypothetical protein KGF57_000255 [Candida theae]